MNYRKKIIQYEEDTKSIQDRQMSRILQIFPYDNPYDQQIESMKIILDILSNKQNLLFQSPTGTGKSLMVMCAAAAFAEYHSSQFQILFLTRTNGQINGLVKELNKIRNIDDFISKYSILAGRNNLCIKKDQFRQYMIDNKIDPNGKNLHKKYDLFCTDCKKCLIKTSAKKDLDNENILKVSESIVIGDQTKETRNNQQQQQQDQSRVVQVMSAIETDLTENQNNEKYITQKNLACLHFGLNEMLKEQEYKFTGYSKVRFMNQTDSNENSNKQNQDFDLKNHLNLLELIEKQEEEFDEDYEFERDSQKYQQFKTNNITIKNEDINPDYEERLPDIEDMVKIFKEKQAQCPFYFNRYIAKQANIVFMNYNYLLNPDILKYVSANIIDRQKKQIIIFDEAHNIEQQAESQFQTKLKLKNLQKSHELITNILITLRLAKQLRILDVLKQKGLELIDKVKESSKSKKNEKKGQDQQDKCNQNGFDVQIKSEYLEDEESEEEFQPQSLTQRQVQNENEEQNIQNKDQEIKQLQSEKNQIQQSTSILKEKDLNIMQQNINIQTIELKSKRTRKHNYQINDEEIEQNILDDDKIKQEIKYQINQQNENEVEIKEEQQSFCNADYKSNNFKEGSSFLDNQSILDELEIENEQNFKEKIQKESQQKEIIKIEDEELNEIAIDFNEKQQEGTNEGDSQSDDKYENQKKILEEFIQNYELKLPKILGYLNKLINYCLTRQSKLQKAESNLLSEYHFIKQYYQLFGLVSHDNDSDKENILKEENEQKTILQEANEVLRQKININSDYQQNMDVLSQFSEFSYIFQQITRYIKVKYSRECQQKAIEDILASAVYYEGNLHQLKVTLRYFANNLQPLNHLTKIKKIVLFLSNLKDFHQLSMIQQQYKKKQSFHYLRSSQKQYKNLQNDQYINEDFNLESPDLQKLQDFYFSAQKNELKEDVIFTLGCLSGKYAFREIFSKLNVHSLILSSGTLEPFDILIKNLDVKFEIYSGKHVIDPQQQVFTQFIKECSNNGKPLNFSFEKIYMDDLEIREQKRQNILSTLQIIQNIVKTIQDQSIKGGVLVFFKSYELMYSFYQAFLGSNAQRELKDIPIFFEKPTNVQFQTDFAHFKKQVLTFKKTSLFFAACRGKLAEGIDLSDSLARCVLLVGVPLWNISDPYFICKKKYVELVLKMDPNEWSRKQVIKCVNQAAGRSIRHRYDWGSVFFICELFDQVLHPKNFKKYISKWILMGENKQQNYIEAYKQFLAKNSNY
ncbi:helicase carboxy-terminal domain protein (macronuclear) [Tetrahymena thermophila SB210]|uniref:Helicase carboxy-terminal domain protein n=1 Tax=Tetrahymena thermophila (strain SB210) TaxID=312017 RepID=Q22MW4_TETTS|nr:helicase carboxy-terminal domain protein [Tetrahymena thermophila SB210]EAR86485.2 helicase carboxy-terminal domain protein [Tetrahymena thermophila SB210]|eukprot:XP_976906.2 helicase carboxy-terminal domain protein [Tetrahymena thermophila SB210]